MKFALIDAASRLVLQWQDTDQFGYAEPLDMQLRHELPGAFEFPDAPRWLVDGELVDSAPPVESPDLSRAVPAVVTMRQARRALLKANKLTAVDAAIAGLSLPEKDEAQIDWEFASTVERASPFVKLLGTALNLDAQAIDELFIQAVTL